MNITALLIGRQGSSFKDKNLLPLAGKPVIRWTAEAAASSDAVGLKFVSSDSQQILDSVNDLGYLPINRPNHLSTATAQGCDVIEHAIQEMQNSYDHVPEYVLLQHANSPTITSNMIVQCFALLNKNPEATAVVPVLIEMDKHPFRQKMFRPDGRLESFFPSTYSVSSNRQELPRSASLAHNFWLIRTPGGRLPQGEGPWTCLGGHVLGFELESAFDIHDPKDLILAENWLRENIREG